MFFPRWTTHPKTNVQRQLLQRTEPAHSSRSNYLPSREKYLPPEDPTLISQLLLQNYRVFKPSSQTEGMGPDISGIYHYNEREFEPTERSVLDSACSQSQLRDGRRKLRKRTQRKPLVVFLTFDIRISEGDTKEGGGEVSSSRVEIDAQ